MGKQMIRFQHLFDASG